MPPFFQILERFCFKEGGPRVIYEPPFKFQPSDSLIGKATTFHTQDLGSTLTMLEYAYTLNYAERRDDRTRGTYQPWAIRKLALYHSYDLDKRKSVYLLISPNPKSRAEADVIEWLTRARDSSDVYEDHFAVHQLILSYHVNNWSPYMDYYERQLGELVSRSVRDALL